MMRANLDMSHLLEKVPDEFNKWLENTVGELENSFEDIKLHCVNIIDGLETNHINEDNRKDKKNLFTEF